MAEGRRSNSMAPIEASNTTQSKLQHKRAPTKRTYCQKRFWFTKRTASSGTRILFMSFAMFWVILICNLDAFRTERVGSTVGCSRHNSKNRFTLVHKNMKIKQLFHLSSYFRISCQIGGAQRLCCLQPWNFLWHGREVLAVSGLGLSLRLGILSALFVFCFLLFGFFLLAFCCLLICFLFD